MNDDETITMLRGALQNLYPEPTEVDLTCALTLTARRPRRTALAMISVCVLAVAILAAAITNLAARRTNTQPIGSGTGVSASTSIAPSISPSSQSAIPQPEPVIVGDRLVKPLSFSSGQLQLTPLPVSYQPTISQARAAALFRPVVGRRAARVTGVRQPPLFLAMLTNYSGPFPAGTPPQSPGRHTGPTPVWVSLEYVRMSVKGPGTHPGLFPALGDQIVTLDAATGRLARAIDVISHPDPAPQPAPASSTQPRGPGRARLPICGDGSLVVSYDPTVLFQATGDRGDAFRVRNQGSPCRITGYPTITLADGHGRPLAFTYTHGHSMYITRRLPEPVALQQGQSAYVAIAKYRCDLAGSTMATALTITLPGQHTAQRVILTGRAQNLAYCTAQPHDPGNTVAISPVVPTANDTIN